MTATSAAAAIKIGDRPGIQTFLPGDATQKSLDPHEAHEGREGLEVELEERAR
jgi:hypothetical protein